MKKLIALGLSALLLAACGGGTVIDTPLSEAEGEAKADSLYEGIETALGDKCVNIDIVLDIADLSETSSGMTMTGTATGGALYQVDTVDNVAYVKEETSVKMTYAEGETSSLMEMAATVEAWYFDGKEATKSDVTLNLFGTTSHEVNYNVDSFEGSGKELALAAIEEVTEYLFIVEWGSMSYYGNSNEGDLRVVAENGYMGNVAVDSFELTFEGGLPTKVVTKQNTDATGEGFESMTTTTATITYPSSMDISTPDLTSEEWAEANA